MNDTGWSSCMTGGNCGGPLGMAVVVALCVLVVGIASALVVMFVVGQCRLRRPVNTTEGFRSEGRSIQGVEAHPVEGRGRAGVHASLLDPAVASYSDVTDVRNGGETASYSVPPGVYPAEPSAAEVADRKQSTWRWFSGWRSPTSDGRAGNGGQVYADNNATTPMFRETTDAMVEAFGKYYGNPSSIHALGKRSADALERSREIIAGLIGAKPQELYFTSGATESNNLAIRGVMRTRMAPAFCTLLGGGGGEDAKAQQAEGEEGEGEEEGGGDSDRERRRAEEDRRRTAAERDRRDRRKHRVRRKIVTSPVEHASVYETVSSIDPDVEVLLVQVDRKGKIDKNHFSTLVQDPEVAMACVIMANNEIGTVQDVAHLARACHRHGVHFHCDMTQVFGKMMVRMEALDVDSATMSAHKFHGPKGVGCLYAREGTWMDNACMTGGSQEGAVRGGTENVAGVCGMAVALSRCDELLALGRDREVRLMRDTVLRTLQTNIPDLVVNGDVKDGLYNTISVCVPDVNSRAIIPLLDQARVYINTGCACSKGQGSATLRSLGLTDRYINGSLRISLSFLTTEEQCRTLCAALFKALDVYSRNAHLVDGPSAAKKKKKKDKKKKE